MIETRIWSRVRWAALLAGRILVWFAAAGFCLAATAQDPASAAGRLIAAQGIPPAVAACAGCHGARGEGGAAFPRLAGTGQAYLQAQLAAFAGGTRKNPIMQPIAQGLSPAQREVIAHYYSQLPAPAAPQAVPTDAADRGALLASRGRWLDQLPACNQCHGPNGIGVGSTFPPLAGLPAAYITAQLLGFKQGTRPPGPLDLMKTIATKLQDDEMVAVGKYYAGLTSTAPAATAATAAPTVTSSPKGKATP